MKCKSLLDGSVSKAEFTVHQPSHPAAARSVANLHTGSSEHRGPRSYMDMGYEQAAENMGNLGG